MIVDQAAQSCVDLEWEAAYRRYQTPEQEIRKFLRRLRWMGADRWERSRRVVELFCGRGNGLRAWEQLGYTRLEGIDLSPTLLADYAGSATCYQADCRELPLESNSRQILCVQGGLHHLQDLPADLERVLSEMHRVLSSDGRVCLVEPWMTPFLALVHRAFAFPLMRRIPTIDALAEMTEREWRTYSQWLNRAREVLELITRYFEPVQRRIAFGKLFFLGSKRSVS